MIFNNIYRIHDEKIRTFVGMHDRGCDKFSWRTLRQKKSASKLLGSEYVQFAEPVLPLFLLNILAIHQLRQRRGESEKNRRRERGRLELQSIECAVWIAKRTGFPFYLLLLLEQSPLPLRVEGKTAYGAEPATLGNPPAGTFLPVDSHVSPGTTLPQPSALVPLRALPSPLLVLRTYTQSAIQKQADTQNANPASFIPTDFFLLTGEEQSYFNIPAFYHSLFDRRHAVCALLRVEF